LEYRRENNTGKQLYNMVITNEIIITYKVFINKKPSLINHQLLERVILMEYY